MIIGAEIMPLIQAMNDSVIEDDECVFAGNLLSSPLLHLESKRNGGTFQFIYLSWDDSALKNSEEYHVSVGYLFPYMRIRVEDGDIFGITYIGIGERTLEPNKYLEITQKIFENKDYGISVESAEQYAISSSEYVIRVKINLSDKIMVGFYEGNDLPILLLPKHDVYYHRTFNTNY